MTSEDHADRTFAQGKAISGAMIWIGLSALVFVLTHQFGWWGYAATAIVAICGGGVWLSSLLENRRKRREIQQLIEDHKGPHYFIRKDNHDEHR